MKNIYLLLKLNRYIKSTRLKNFGIFLFHVLGRRYYGIFLDPVFACNLRCKMCYFSDPEKRKTMQRGIFKQEDLPKLANAFFHRALKLQIGCGAEPSLFPYNLELIRLGKEKKVPYISMTTNGNLFKENDWWDLVKAGLDEITLSVHGLTKQSYEYFMEGGSFEVFLASMETLTNIKNTYPDLKIRLNYTVNKDNQEELVTLFDTLGSYKFDILQIRPIQQLGDTSYHDFSWEGLYERYDDIIRKVISQCKERQIVCMAPGKDDLIKEGNSDRSIVSSTFFYISPEHRWRSDFDLDTETYESYAKRTHLGRKLLSKVFRSNKKDEANKKNLNYDVV